MFGTRKKNEHLRGGGKKKNIWGANLATKQKAEQENLKSAISDQYNRENHIMDWKKAKVIQTETNKFHR